MGKIFNRKNTPNQRRLATADKLLEKRLARLKRQGFIFNEGVGIPSHPKRITKKYLETYEKNIKPRNLKKFATGKRSIINGKKVLESIEAYEKRIKDKKERVTLPESWEETVFDTPDKRENIPYTSVDFNEPEPTPFSNTVDEDYIAYKNVVDMLKSASGNTPFAKYLLDVIEDELPNLGVTRQQLNVAFSRMNDDGIILERELLYEGEEVSKYLRELVNRLPVDNETKELYNEVIENNEIFYDPAFDNYMSQIKMNNKEFYSEFNKQYRRDRNGQWVRRE